MTVILSLELFSFVMALATGSASVIALIVQWIARRFRGKSAAVIADKAEDSVLRRLCRLPDI